MNIINAIPETIGLIISAIGFVLVMIRKRKIKPMYGNTADISKWTYISWFAFWAVVAFLVCVIAPTVGDLDYKFILYFPGVFFGGGVLLGIAALILRIFDGL